ncbi:unnamed protein product [Closterium sp. NIES-53]
MASIRVFAFDHEGRPVQFDTWLDDLQLYLQSNSKDSVSLFDLASGAAFAPPATADIATRSQWLTHDLDACLAIRNHLPLAKCAHFGQHKTAQALYNAVVARHSSRATAALGRLLQPYLFPELSAFTTVEDLVSHLCTSDARYRATIPAEFLDWNQPPMYITLYFIVIRLPISLRSVRDQFLSLDPTSLTVDPLEQHLLAAETSAHAVGAARGTPRPPFFEGCSPSPLAPSYTSAAAADVLAAEDVRAACASAKRRSGKGKGRRGGGGGSGSGGEGSCVGGGGSGGGGSAGSGGGGGGVGDGLGARPSRPSNFVSGFCSVGRLRVVAAARMSFAQVTVLVTHAGSFTLSTAASPASTTLDVLSLVTTSSSLAGLISLAAAALGASESGTLRGTAPTQALHTFTLDSSASCCFFRDSTTLTPLPALVPVRLADPSGAPVVARSSTVLPCPTVPSGSLSGLHLPSFSTNLVSTAALQDAIVTTTTPGGQRVSICTCTRTGRHLATFTRQPRSSLYALATELCQVVASTQVSASGQVPPPCLCRLLSHQTLLWHHRLGHPSPPRLCGMHSRLLVSGLPRSLPSLPPSPAPPCLPCVEGRQRAAPHSSFPATTTPLQTLHMDVKIQVVDVLIPWIRTVRLQLRKRFSTDLPVLRLHSDRGGEFSSNLLRDFCHGEGILQSFMLPASPKQNGIAERRIGLVMEVARTSMIHAAAPHFLWLFGVRYAAHQLNLWPRVSLPETPPTLRWTGKVGDASVFRVRGSHAFVRDPSADNLSARAIPCVFLGFVPDARLAGSFTTLPRAVSSPLRTSRVSQVDPPPGAVPGEVAVDSCAARGTVSWGAEFGGVGTGGTAPGGAETGGAAPGGVDLGGVETGGAEPGGAETTGVEPAGAVSEGDESEANGAGGAGAAGAGGAGVAARAGVTRGTVATGPGGARTRGTGAVRIGGVGCARAGDPTESGAAGSGGSGAGGAGAGGAGVGGTGAGGDGVKGTRAGGAEAGGAGAVDPGGAVRPRPYFVLWSRVHLGVVDALETT